MTGSTDPRVRSPRTTANLPGPSRRITVEPIRVPAEPREVPERPPAEEPARTPEREPEPARGG
jgi:hypothetical protein